MYVWVYVCVHVFGDAGVCAGACEGKGQLPVSSSGTLSTFFETGPHLGLELRAPSIPPPALAVLG